MNEKEIKELWKAIYELRFQINGLQALYSLGGEIDHQGRESYLMTSVKALPPGLKRDAALAAYRRIGWLTPEAETLINELETGS